MTSLFFKVAQLSILALCLTPAADAQVRFVDGMQQPPRSRWDAAIGNIDSGSVHISRRMPNIASRHDSALANRAMSQRDASPATSAAPAHDAGLAMPHWTTSFETDDVEYPFTVVGSDPSQGKTTTIPTVIIPYRLIFPDGHILDATTDIVDGVTPLNGVVNSPIFKAVSWSAGHSQLGVTQWGDAVMQANFWSSIHGDDSQGNGYHVLLAPPVIAPVQVITVPAGFATTALDSAGTRVGFVDEGWLTNLTDSLTASLGIPPQALAIHLMSAVEALDLNGGSSLGYHFELFEGTAASPVIQPYIQTAYFSTASEEGQKRPDVAGTGVLGHEIADWLNDPVGDNYVPAWQDPGSPHVCDNPFLEVADPLESTSLGIRVALNGRSYQFPEVALLPWFTRGRSTSVNGWYSSLNSFSTPSAACPVFTNFGNGYISFSGVTSTQLTGVNNGVNNKMQVTGYTASSNTIGGFVLDFTYTPAFTASNVREVYVPGSNATVPVKINDAGQMVGLYYDTAGAVHGFLFSNGQYSAIDFPGAVATEALAINNWEVPAIAGDYTDTGGKVHGFVLLGKQFLPVNAGFAVNLSVRGINDLAQMTGAYDLGGALGTAPTYGFTGFPGFLTPLQYPEAEGQPTYTVASSLNNNNQVAGQVQIQQANGFLQEMPYLEGGGNFQPTEGGTAFTAAAALGNNDANVLVGWFQNSVSSPGLTFGGVLFPVPETGVIAGHVSVQLPLTLQLHSLN
jgi:hypothetical protein